MALGTKRRWSVRGDWGNLCETGKQSTLVCIINAVPPRCRNILNEFEGMHFIVLTFQPPAAAAAVRSPPRKLTSGWSGCQTRILPLSPLHILEQIPKSLASKANTAGHEHDPGAAPVAPLPVFAVSRLYAEQQSHQTQIRTGRSAWATFVQI